MIQHPCGPAPTAVPARRAVFSVFLATLVFGLACASSRTSGSLEEVMRASALASVGNASGLNDKTLSAPEAALRQFVKARDSVHLKQAMAAMPKDTLLRLLNWGLAYHRLGKYAASNRALEAADKEADNRYTKSVSQNIGAALVNDQLLNYTPGAHERAFMHYYGMLNYLALGNTDEALVEARRANEFLQRYARENGARSFTRDATVEYVAGMLHLGSGDPNDAMQSFRGAAIALDGYSKKYGVASPQFVGSDLARLSSSLGIPELTSEVSARYQLKPEDLAPQNGMGSLVVLVENGYIAHRREEKVYIPILDDEANALVSSSVDTAALLVAPRILLRTLNLFYEASTSDGEYDKPYQDGMLIGGMVRGADFISMAWPKYVLNTHGAASVTVTAGTVTQTALVMDDLSAIAARAFEEEKPKVIDRMIFRGLVKYGGTKYAEKKANEAGEKQGAGLGKLFGGVAKLGGNLVASATEKADTRSWSLLPGEVRVARFSLPPGVHDVTITVTSADGSTRPVRLGPVTIEPNKVVVKSQFVDGDYRGDETRFANARKHVDYKAAQDVAAGAASETDVFGPIGAGVIAAASPVAGPVIPAGAPASAPAQTVKPRTAAAIVSVTPVVGSFHPLAEESARFAVRMGAPATAGAKATTSLLVVRSGTADTALVWSGAEGDTVFWNAMRGTTPVEAGQYSLIWRTKTPTVSGAVDFITPAALEVDRPRETLLPSPVAPTYEAETQMIDRPDYGRKHSKKKKGIILGGLGAAAMTFGYAGIKTAIETSPPGSTARMTSLGIWGGGLLFTTVGGISFTQGILKNYMHPVREPNGGAIDRNKAAREEHERATAEVKAQQERIKAETVVRIRIGGGK